jgi:hypothetical protein
MAPGTVTAPITMRDAAGQIVMTAHIDFHVSAQK